MLSGLLLAMRANKYGSFVMKYWAIIVLILLVLGVWWYHNNLTKTIENLHAEVTRLNVELSSCNGALTNQNSAIAVISQSGQSTITKVKKETAAKIAKLQSNLQLALDALQSQPVAQTCEAAIEELRSKAQGSELKWEK